MAKAVISDISPVRTNKVNLKRIGVAKFIDVPGKVKIDATLPFRVKFINIGIDAYGPNNPAPIGIAVVGYNNYVL
jgi:hypothetical protein